MAPSNAVRAVGLTKRFGSVASPDGIDVTVPSGTTFGLIGPSGSGKTTTVRLLAGYHARTAGDVQVLGHDPARFGEVERRRIGYLAQRPVLYPKLSIAANVNFVASLYGVRQRRRRIAEVLEFVELADHRRKRLADASGGMQRRAALATALVHDPELLFLDEPTSGLDPLLRAKLWDHFGSLRDEGRTLIVTTQYIEEAVRCDEVGLMVDGRLIAVDTPEGLRARADDGATVRMLLDGPAAFAAAAKIADAGVVRRVAALDATTIEAVVDDGAAAVPRLVQLLGGVGAAATSVEVLDPSMEQVFATLVARYRTGVEEVGPT